MEGVGVGRWWCLRDLNFPFQVSWGSWIIELRLSYKLFFRRGESHITTSPFQLEMAQGADKVSWSSQWRLPLEEGKYKFY